MTTTLALDLSVTSSGWAVFDSSVLTPDSLKSYGKFPLGGSLFSQGAYPWNYIDVTEQLADKIGVLVQEHTPDVVVIEETCLGRSSYAQKALEMLHSAILRKLRELKYEGRVHYIRPRDWRSALKIVMSKADKVNNKTLSKAKKSGLVDKKALGVKGKITPKHLSVRYVNDTFGLDLKMKDEDIADAICLGWAEMHGAQHCDGKK